MSRKIFDVINTIVRNHIVNAVCLMILTAFFFVNALGIDYYHRLELINSYNDTPYNKHTVNFFFEADEAYINLEWLSDSEILDECVLLQYADNNELYKVIYCDKDAVSLSESKIVKWDNNSKEAMIVVGCDTGYSVGEKKNIGGVDYNVVGIIDEHISEAVNRGFFYTNNDLTSIDTEKRYILTSANFDIIDNKMEQFEEILASKDIKTKKIDVRNSEFSDYVEYENALKLIIVFLVIFYILFICAVTAIWWKLKRSHIYVRNLLGEKYVKVKIASEYICIWLGAFVIGSVLFYMSI